MYISINLYTFIIIRDKVHNSVDFEINSRAIVPGETFFV